MVGKIDTQKHQVEGIAIRHVEFEFPLNKQILTVLASPNPAYLSDNGIELLNQCDEAGYRVYLSLEEQTPALVEMLKSKCKKEYSLYELPTSDYGPPNVSEFYKIIVKKVLPECVEKNDCMFIHCGAGNGRTGTILAGLKLLEILQKKYISDPVDFASQIEQEINLGDKENIYIPALKEMRAVPKLIALAINEVRVIKCMQDRSVESSAQVDFLQEVAITYAKELDPPALKPKLRN